MLGKIGKQLKNLQIQVAQLTQIKIQTLEKKVATLTAELNVLKAQKPPPLQNIAAVTNNQKQEIVAAPTKPTTTTPPPESAAGITMPQTTQTQGMSNALSNLFNTNTAHALLGACGFIESVGTLCDAADTMLYAWEGDKTGAMLSGGSMVPGIGIAAGVAKLSRLALAPLRTAMTIPEFLKVADTLKIAGAGTSDSIKVLKGSADDAREVFEVQTKGWTTLKDEPLDDGSNLLLRESPDSLYTMGYRTKSTIDTKVTFNGDSATIKATLDIQRYERNELGELKSVGAVRKVKFAE